MIKSAPVQHLDLDPRGADLLELLRDLGHIDGVAIEALTNEILSAGRAERRVSFDELRRSVAVWLFDHEANLRPDQRDLLNAEWGRLFY